MDNKKISILFLISDIGLAIFSIISAVMLPVMTVESAKVQGGPPAIVVTLICLAAAAVFTILSVMYFIYKKRKNKALYYVIILTNLAILAAFVTSTTYSAIKQDNDRISKQQSEESITQSNKLIKPVKIVDTEKIKALIPSFKNYTPLEQSEKDRLKIDSLYSYKTQDIYKPGSYIEKDYIVYLDAETNLKIAFDCTLDNDMYKHIHEYLFISKSKKIVDEMKSKLTSENMVITAIYLNYKYENPPHFYEYNVTDFSSLGIKDNYIKYDGYTSEDLIN